MESFPSSRFVRSRLRFTIERGSMNEGARIIIGIITASGAVKRIYKGYIVAEAGVTPSSLRHRFVRHCSTDSHRSFDGKKSARFRFVAIKHKVFRGQEGKEEEGNLEAGKGEEAGQKSRRRRRRRSLARELSKIRRKEFGGTRELPIWQRVRGDKSAFNRSGLTGYLGYVYPRSFHPRCHGAPSEKTSIYSGVSR